MFGKKQARPWRGVINEYRHRLPITSKTPIVTLNEGGTPLVYACVLSEMLAGEVWVKVEGSNPTGSFKDRGMTMAMSKAAEDGAKVVGGVRGAAVATHDALPRALISRAVRVRPVDGLLEVPQPGQVQLFGGRATGERRDRKGQGQGSRAGHGPAK